MCVCASDAKALETCLKADGVADGRSVRAVGRRTSTESLYVSQAQCAADTMPHEL